MPSKGRPREGRARGAVPALVAAIGLALFPAGCGNLFRLGPQEVTFEAPPGRTIHQIVVNEGPAQGSGTTVEIDRSFDDLVAWVWYDDGTAESVVLRSTSDVPWIVWVELIVFPVALIDLFTLGPRGTSFPETVRLTGEGISYDAL